MYAFWLHGLGPDLTVTPMTKSALVVFFSFFFLCALHRAHKLQKKKQKKKTLLNFFAALLPSFRPSIDLVHTLLQRHSPPPIDSLSDTKPLSTPIPPTHRTWQKEEQTKEWKKESDSVSFFLSLYIYTSLHKEPTLALIPSPDSSVRCPCCDKERHIYPSTQPQTLIRTIAQLHLWIFLYNTRLSNHPSQKSFVCSFCFCLVFPRPNPQMRPPSTR